MSVLAFLDVSHLPVLVVIGLAIFFGTVGARLFHRLHIPRVVGYITVGLIVGSSGLKIIDERTVESLEPFNFFALGVIGFLIGGELHRDVFRKHGRQFLTILVSEGLGAFVLVALSVGAVVYFIRGDLMVATAMGLVFGALSSATAPAATANTLWEYRTLGVLTTATFAIVALDDALALVLYSLAAGAATILTGHGQAGLAAMLGRTAWELLGGAGLGVLAGILLNLLVRRSRDHDSALAFIVGALALVIGAARAIGLDAILATMALGAALSNLAPRRSSEAFRIVERFAPPLYVLFFVIVGAHIHLGSMPAWMWALAVPYVVARSLGKILGSNFGARLAGAPAVLRKYLGFCLFCQGGVAVGLSIMAASRFPAEYGAAFILIIAVTTFIVEVLGPPFVKFAARRAGEIGLNVTEEDLIGERTVGDMVSRTVPKFGEDTPLSHILRTIAETDATTYPVTDRQGALVGVVTIQDLKQSFRAEGLTDWLVAFDVMQPVADTVTEDLPLSEAVTRMREQELDYLPVLAVDDRNRLVGLLELRKLNRDLSGELLRRRRKAEASHELEAVRPGGES
ncbi:MAG: cation:proton antiporter [Phycisphaerae bacterium]